MKLHTALFMLLSVATLSTARADTDALAGHWRGTLVSPIGESAIDLQFDQGSSGYRGHYSSATPSATTFPVNAARSGQVIRFVVPNVGVFQGKLHGGILEGTYTGPEGTGPFRLDKEQAGDDLRFVD